MDHPCALPSIARPFHLQRVESEMKTIIAGCRKFVDYEEVVRHVNLSGFNITEVVSGGCGGVDKLGERFAKERGIGIKRFPYEGKYGKAGGPIRNRKMAEYGEALIAISSGGNGTKNMIEEAKKRGLKLYVHDLP